MTVLKNRRGSEEIAFNRISFDLVTDDAPVDLSDFRPHGASPTWYVNPFTIETELAPGSQNRFHGAGCDFTYQPALNNSDKSFYFEFHATTDAEMYLQYSVLLSGLDIYIDQSDGIVSIYGVVFDGVDYFDWHIVDNGGETGFATKVRLTMISGSIFVSVQKDGEWLVPFVHINGEVKRAVFEMPGDELDPHSMYGEINLDPYSGYGFSLKSSFDPIVYFDTPQLDSAPFCHFKSANDGFLSFSSSDLPEGEHVLSYLNNDYILNVTSGYDSTDAPILMQSSVKNLVSDGGSILVCQEEAAPGIDNVGHVSVIPNCCFEDGSLRDSTPFEVVTTKSGYLTQQNDRTQIPEFNFRESDGKQYGCNFDFQRVLKNEWAFEHQPILMRQCAWSTGKRVFYGLTSPITTLPSAITLDVSFTHYTRDLTDVGAPGESAESAYIVKVFREDDPVEIYSSGIIKSPTFGINQVLTIPDFNAGRFFVEVTFYSWLVFGGQDIFFFPIKDMQAIVKIFHGADLIEQGTFRTLFDMFLDEFGYEGASDTYDAGRTDILTGTEFPYYTRSKLHFELMPLEADLVVSVYDPDTSAFIEYPDGESNSISTKLSKVLTKSRSISAIELSNGHICLFYRAKDVTLSNPFFDSFELNQINYDVVDIYSGTIVYSGVIEFESYLSNTHSLHSFEVVREDDTVLIFTSWRDLDIRVQKPSDRHPLITYPIVPGSVGGTKVFSLNWESAFLTTSVSLGGHRAEVDLKPIIDAQRLLNPDYFAKVSGRNLSFKFAMAGTMRASYCEEMDVTVLSLVDNSSRQPLILMGKGGHFKAVAAPAFFNTSTPDIYVRSFNIEAVSSVINHDGMIYSVASKGTWTQLAVIDPSIYWRANATLIDAENPYVNRTGEVILTDTLTYPNWTKKDFDDHFISILADRTREVISMAAFRTRPVILDIGQYQQYMAISSGSEVPFNHFVDRSYPLIVHQNGHLDTAPGETICAFAWQPHYETGSGFNYQLSEFIGAVYPISNNSFGAIRNNSSDLVSLTPPSVDIGNLLMIKHRLGEGYKFKARIRTTEPYATNFVMSANATGFYSSYDWKEIRLTPLPLTTFDLVYALAGFEISEDYVQPFRAMVTGGARTFIGDPIPIVQGETYDLFIFMKQVERDLAQVTWLVKKPTDFDSMTYDFKNEVIGYTAKVIPLYRDVGNATFSGVPDTALTVNTEGSDAFETIEIHSLELGLLRNESSDYDLFRFDKGSGVDYILVERQSSSEFGRWRQFNDERLLGYDGQPQYSYRIGFSDFNQESMSFHYYNGFTFTFRNSTTYTDDFWTVNRIIANPISSAHVTNLHGYWISDVDNQEIVFDLENVDTGKFRVDCAVMSGMNFRFAHLLSYDATLDEYTYVGVFDSTYFSTEITQSSRVGDIGLIMLKHELDLGKLSEEVKYISVDGLRPMKIIDVRGYSIKVEVPFPVAIPTGEAVIFGGKSLVRFNEPTSADGLRVVIPPQLAFEEHYQVHIIDAGKVLDVYPDTIGENYFTEECSVNRDLIVGSQAFSQRETISQEKNVNLVYTTHVVKTWMEITAMVESLSVSRIPVWIFRDMKYKRKDYHLALVTSSPSYSLLLDDDGDESYQITVPLRAVE